jgi:putative transposase
MVLQKNHVQFFTAVCYDWLRLLDSDEAKLIVIESLKFRIAQGQVKVGAYVIMPNHIHIIWRIQNDFKLEDVQRDFLKFTAKKIIERIRQRDGQVLVGQKVILGCCCGSPDPQLVFANPLSCHWSKSNF